VEALATTYRTGIVQAKMEESSNEKKMSEMGI